jgi:uncharacterized protein (TIGR04255 family)
MTIHPNPPLVEAAFELRWGKTKKTAGGTTFELSPEDMMFFLGQFNAKAVERGFSSVTPITNPLIPIQMPGLSIPHNVSHRYKRPGNEHQIIQAGLGVITINHLAEGYDWAPFKELIQTGLKLLDEGHPQKLAGLEPVFIELRYQDAFYYDGHKNGLDVYNEELSFSPIELPVGVMTSDLVKGDTLDIASFVFVLNLAEIDAKLHLSFFDANIGGRKGAILQLSARSMPSEGESAPRSADEILDWCEKAHKAHILAFNELVVPKRK